MKREPKNPNDHQIITPSTKGKKKDDRKFTSYDTGKRETSTPQKVREGTESSGEMVRQKKALGHDEEG
ncbi:MAG TPA: hypothetical protein VK666_07470 [Chryseolinea sp.]|nr:hypothetical protein [Chryseolinea sp.]